MIVNARHAMYVAWIAAIAIDNGVWLAPVLDPLGNPTDRLELLLPAGDDADPVALAITLVVPHPGDEWIPPR